MNNYKHTEPQKNTKKDFDTALQIVASSWNLYGAFTSSQEDDNRSFRCYEPCNINLTLHKASWYCNHWHLISVCQPAEYERLRKLCLYLLSAHLIKLSPFCVHVYPWIIKQDIPWGCMKAGLFKKIVLLKKIPQSMLSKHHYWKVHIRTVITF